MDTLGIIRKKRDGETLTTREIQTLIHEYAKGNVPDYQMSAWAMAVFFNGMTEKETSDLTMAMVTSGEQIDLSSIPGKKVDKHSTGGVGDKTTLILAPLVAAAGVPVAKLSGRGLGHTGGTIDKLESFPGFSTELDTDQFIQKILQSNIAVTAQTKNLTPADKKLYSLRDVTATVDSIPLIASSIMSKKIAAGADAIVLDVKTGDGALMKDKGSSIQLAKTMVAIGKHMDRQTVAVISDMNQPLGFAVGNSLEVQEAIEVLKGRGPADVRELSLVLGSHMLVLAGRCNTSEEAYGELEHCIEEGHALQKMKEWIEGQGGNFDSIDSPKRFPQPKEKISVQAQESGILQAIYAEEIGLCAMKLGAGRTRKEDQIDHGVGILLQKKVGEEVRKGDTLAMLYLNDMSTVEEVTKRLRNAFQIGPQRIEQPPLIHCVITR